MKGTITNLYAGVPVSRPHDRIQTYSNGVSHVKIPDPDGNATAFGGAPDAATASPR